jgi:hypothetical protein
MCVHFFGEDGVQVFSLSSHVLVTSELQYCHDQRFPWFPSL